jgi:hypothetical protein
MERMAAWAARPVAREIQRASRRAREGLARMLT